jgi:predicted anti-sigma-YlaC factor YlaD
MSCTDWNEKLNDSVDGALGPEDDRALDAHLRICPACRAQLESLQSLRTATRQLPREISPQRELWTEIEVGLSRSVSARGRMLFASFAAWKIACCIGIVLTAAGLWRWNATRSPAVAWQIAAIAGMPQINTRGFSGQSTLQVGEWLETDASARAKVSVGKIGEVDVAPNSRIRLINASATDHRLELARGTMSALIWAPPRLFFVNTPSAVAVDLGCAYTLNVDDDGNGTLHVTSGYVALQHAGRETIISAGQMCTTRRDAGPGTPFVEDAPAALRRALDRFDFEHAPDALAEILTEARTADSLTLFRLLERGTAIARGEIFDVLARDHPPPAAVTKAGIIDGNKTMLAAWSADLGVRGFSNP